MKPLQGDDLTQRVTTSRMLGQGKQLVVSGGGNTSVKIREKDFFGEEDDILYIKGSGWDLATIEKEGFAPVKMSALLKLAQMETLSDSDMMRQMRAALTNPAAPDPSVEALLHAIIPYKFVDHTHADAVVTIMNTPNGEARIRELYGDKVLIVPYVMPGFKLARSVYAMTRAVDWSQLQGIVLMKHGIFAFGDTAQASYDRMIELVMLAEKYVEDQTDDGSCLTISHGQNFADWRQMARLRQVVSKVAGRALIARPDLGDLEAGFANLPNVADIATRGCMTPDHIIRTKRIPLIIENDMQDAVDRYVEDYQAYFARNTDGTQTMLDPAPRWAVWRNMGSVTFGETVQAADSAGDIAENTLIAIQFAEAMGGWQSLPEKDLFDMEYWELEQAKLKSMKSLPSLTGKIALVTGAASGIGKACADHLLTQGAVVVALDINPEVRQLFPVRTAMGLVCDVTDDTALKNAIETTIKKFGGLDIVVANAGIFPSSMTIENMDAAMWERSLAINLTAQQRLIQYSIPYLRYGINPTIIFIASKNVPAPGPGAAAYSVAKAGVTQLARVAALELAGDGIRVNTIHPDAVFDTGLWTPEILAKRAASYGMTVEQYKTKNLLRRSITSMDVALMVGAVAGEAFYNTTGAQIPLDGGNDRVI